MTTQLYSDIPHYPVVRINSTKCIPIKHSDKAERILNHTIISGIVLVLISLSVFVFL